MRPESAPYEVREFDRFVGVFTLATAPTPFLVGLITEASIIDGPVMAKDPEGREVTVFPVG